LPTPGLEIHSFGPIS